MKRKSNVSFLSRCKGNQNFADVNHAPTKNLRVQDYFFLETREVQPAISYVGFIQITLHSIEQFLGSHAQSV